ncbi:hypothetical protein L798_05969 [Zootermopsis nevadensis]|uniref:Uncharacterized protein n=2 Tax=Zootermopsis nevadensis TaxID=136037 RepID=A0A067RKJ9_ZOONE|nr:hypothetical protein L798_05969 [Zootermopsis nevadensis]
MQRKRNLQTSAEPPISPAVLPTAANSRGNAYPRRGSWSRSRDSEDELEDRQQQGGYFGVHALQARDGFDTPEPDLPADDTDDVFEHGYNRSPMRHVTRRDSYNNRQVPRENLHHHHHDNHDAPMRHGHRPLKTNAQIYRGGRSRGSDEPRPVSHQRYRSPSREDTRPQHMNSSPSRRSRNAPDEEIVPERRQVAHRFRSPTRVARGEQDFSPDRRELSPTRNPRPQPRCQRKPDEETGYPVDEVQRYRGGPRDRIPNPSRGHLVLSQQASFSEDSNSDIPLERYRSPMHKQPLTPRHRIKEDEDIGSPEPQRRNMDNRLPRANPFQTPGGGDKKRRSMFDVLEEERRRSSNELAKEFKRRSYQDGGGSELSSGNRGSNHNNNGVPNGRHPGYQELSEHERFPGLDRETARLQHHMSPANGGHLNLKKSSGPPPPPDVVTAASSRYRHSYAEPHHVLSHPQSSHHHEMLHRTNSSVSSGRVGIAAVHPY